MARLHVMTGNGSNTYQVVCHSPTPAGSNSAGVSWATALKNAMNPVTVMSIGSGSGQISTAESNGVANGSIIEVSFQFDDDPTWDMNTRNSQLNLIASDAVTRAQNDLSSRLKWFGAVVA